MKNLIALLITCILVAMHAKGESQAGNENASTRVGPPTLFADRVELGRVSTATIHVDNSTLPAAMIPATNLAGEIWSYLITSNQPITIRIIRGTLVPLTLASTVCDSHEAVPGYVERFPTALAEMLAGTNLNGNNPEMTITVNSRYDTSWYYGVDGNPQGLKRDLVTVILHEIAHGLGFHATFRLNTGGQGIRDSAYIIYDKFCANEAHYPAQTSNILINYPFPSSQVAQAITGDNLYFSGPKSWAAGNSSTPRLYASHLSEASIVSHLNDATYPTGGRNSLMTHELGYAEAIHSPGEIGLSILADLHWQVNRMASFTRPYAGITKHPGDSVETEWYYTDEFGADLSVDLYKKNSFGTYVQHRYLGTTRSGSGLNSGVYLHLPADVDTGWYKIVFSLAAERIGMSYGFLVAEPAIVETPQLTPPGGYYNVPRGVNMYSATPGAEIHYTLGGGEPTIDSARYFGSVPVDYTLTIRAKAFKDGHQSQTAVERYVIGTCDGPSTPQMLSSRKKDPIQYLNQGVPAYTLGGSSYPYSGTYDLVGGYGTEEKARAFFEWDIPNEVIPDNAAITCATIEFQTYSWGGTYVGRLFRTTGTWNNDQALWLSATGASVQDNIIFDSGYWGNLYFSGSPFVAALQQCLASNIIQLALVSQNENQSNTYVRIQSARLRISYTTPVLHLSQVTSSGTPFGQFGRWNGAQWISYRDTTLPRPTTATTLYLKADTNYKAGTYEKYNHWSKNGSQSFVINHADIPVDSNTAELKAQFLPSAPATIQAQLLDGAGSGGVVSFRDPWVIDDSDGKGSKNRGTSAVWHHNLPAPFKPELSTSYKGVFLNENPDPQNPNKPYYSVGAPQTQVFTIGGQNHSGNFISWSGHPDSVSYRSPLNDTTALVFKLPGATATAKYKAHLASNSSSALANNSQRKIVRDSFGGYHMVYPSGGNIWYCRSTDGGTTWLPEIQLNSAMLPSEGALNRLPSIAFIPGTTDINSSVMVVWEVYDEEETSRGLSTCELHLNGQRIGCNENFRISLGGPGSAPGIGIGRTGDFRLGFTYYPLILWYDPMYPTSSLRAMTRWGGVWYEEGLNGLTNVTQFGVAPFCYRGYNTAEWDIVYVLNEALYYAPISAMNLSAPTLGSPQMVTAGGTSRDVRKPSIYVAGGNVEPVTGEPVVTWEQSRPTSAIGMSKRTGSSSWDRPAYFSHHGHEATNPVIGVYCDAGTSSLFIDLLWQCGNHVARASRPVQNPLWSPIADLGTGGAPAISATLLPTGPTLRATVTSSGQLFAIGTATLSLPQFEQWGANWNITGIAVRVSNYAPTAVFPSANPVYKMECEGYVLVTTRCDSNRGFWAKFPSTQPTWPISYAGTFIDSMAMPVRNCWNMIGSISVPVDTSSVRYYPSGIRASSFFKYTTGTGYVIVTELNPGLGFWVKSNQNGLMVLQNSPMPPPPQGLSVPRDEFIVTDNAGNRQELFVVNAESEGAESIEMPPPPPEFDARWEAGNIQMSIDPSRGPVELPIRITASSYPITLEWDLNPATGLEYVLPGGGGLGKGTSPISGRNHVTIPSATNRIALNAYKKGDAKPIELPTEYALHQNYPNPFNPTTEIRFDLPDAGNVSLVVYDVLGREVATLASEYREAGYHSARWNASGQASGVYFARFNVANAEGKIAYSKVSKLVLMK